MSCENDANDKRSQDAAVDFKSSVGVVLVFVVVRGKWYRYFTLTWNHLTISFEANHKQEVVMVAVGEGKETDDAESPALCACCLQVEKVDLTWFDVCEGE